MKPKTTRVEIIPEDLGGIDEESAKGRFGWTTIGNIHIPYIFRPSGHYSALRIINLQILSKLSYNLLPEFSDCLNVHLFYMTPAEATVLNEINIVHCDALYGLDNFTSNDILIRTEDAHECFQFLAFCYSKIVGNTDIPERCGFIQINKQPVVPYTVYKGERHIPIYFFEGHSDKLKQRAVNLKGWDLAYLKFCFKIRNVRYEFVIKDSCDLISFKDVQKLLHQDTVFEDFWPEEDFKLFKLVKKFNETPKANLIASVVNNKVTMPTVPFLAPVVVQVFQPLFSLKGRPVKIVEPVKYAIFASPKPYELRYNQVLGKNILCINLVAFNYTRMMMTLADMARNFFIDVPLKTLHQALNVLKIDLFSPNQHQMMALVMHNKCILKNPAYLVMVNDITTYFVQLKYICLGKDSI